MNIFKQKVIENIIEVLGVPETEKENYLCKIS